jgi:hypothetical protein
MRAAENDAAPPDTAAQADGDQEADVPAIKQHAKKHAAAHSHPSSKTAAKASGGKSEDAEAMPEYIPSLNISPSVANANAQMQNGAVPAQTGTPTENALKAMSSQADSTLNTARQTDPNSPQADPSATTETIPADQLSDADRTLSEAAPPPAAPEPTAAPTPVSAVARVPAASSYDDSTWSQTSVIGKVFIAFGGLLTLASAARMFMA